MLDDWIDGALSGYSSTEPLAGLDDRVLRRIRAAEAARTRSGVRLALAFPTLASLLVASIVLWTTPPEQPLVLPAPRIASAPTLAHRTVFAPQYQVWGAAGHVQERKPPPPITDQERDLLALLTRAPGALQALADLQKKSSEPLEIEPIQIQPLPSDGAP